MLKDEKGSPCVRGICWFYLPGVQHSLGNDLLSTLSPCDFPRDEHMTQIWPVSLFRLPGNSNWIKDGHVTETGPTNGNPRLS